MFVCCLLLLLFDAFPCPFDFLLSSFSLKRFKIVKNIFFGGGGVWSGFVGVGLCILSLCKNRALHIWISLVVCGKGSVESLSPGSNGDMLHVIRVKAATSMIYPTPSQPKEIK